MTVVPKNVPKELKDSYKIALENSGAYYPLYSNKSQSMNGIIGLVFTTAIITDLNETGYSARFCYASNYLAHVEHAKWHKKHFSYSFLPRGWIACRGLTKSELISGFPVDYGQSVIETYKRLFTSKPKLFSEIDDKKLKLAEEMQCSVNDVEHLGAYLRCIGLLE